MATIHTLPGVTLRSERIDASPNPEATVLLSEVTGLLDDMVELSEHASSNARKRSKTATVLYHETRITTLMEVKALVRDLAIHQEAGAHHA